MAGWVVKLAGSEFDLNALVKVCTAPDCHVTKDEGAYFLASTDFTAMQEAGDVWKVATERMLPTINGLMKVRNVNYQPVLLESVIKLNPDGSRVQGGYVFFQGRATANARLSAEGAEIGVNGMVIPSREPARFQARRKLVRQDAEMCRALSFWRACDAADPNFWWNAYKVFEVIRDDLAGGRDRGQGTEEMKTRGWATQGDIRNFKASANNRDISGEKARHAEKQSQKPGTSALNEREALAIIQRLLDCWLDAKTTQAGLWVP